MRVLGIKWTTLISLSLLPVLSAAAPKNNASPPTPPSVDTPIGPSNRLPNTNLSLGIHGGAALASNGTANATFGLMGEYRIERDLGIGAYASNLLAGGASTPFGSTTGNLLILAAEGNYHLPTELAPVLYGAYVGLKAGLAINFFRSSIPGVPSSTDAGFVVGPAVGYDFGVTDKVSIGAQVNDLIVTNSSSGGVLNIFDVLAVAKYFFL